MRRREIPGEPPPPTKGELKRRAQSLQELGEALVAAPDDLLDGLGLPEKLRDAIDLARRITSRSALVRQRQYIGKLMRQVDDVPIRSALEAAQERHRLDARRFKRIELWRDRLIAEGEPAVEALLAERPGLDAAELRRLAAAARAARGPDGHHGTGRTLFRFLSKSLQAGQD
jgi:ribosome-associated protein